MKVENITTLNGQLVEKMSVKQIVKDLTELGYVDAYVSSEPDKSAPFDVQSHLLYEAASNIALDEESERWFKIRIDPAPNANGKSKNVPVSVSFNDNIGYIPRSVPVWVRGRFVHCLEEAVEVHTIQADISAPYAAAARRDDYYRYPYKVMAVGGFVKDGLPEVKQGEQIIYSDKQAKAARQRLDAVGGRVAA